MKQEEIGKGYIILGYFLLPFVGIYKWIVKNYKEMNTGFKIIFVYVLLVTILMIWNLITSL